MSAEGLTRRVAHYATALRYESIAPEVIDRAKQLLLDYLGVAIGGRILAASSPALVTGVKALAAGATGEASVVGETAGFTAHHAALLNAGFAHSMDFDDTHRDAIMHQGTPLFAALLALGETTAASGSDVLAAAVAGYEIGGKLGRAHGDKVHLRGFHPSATTGIFAVTAAAGRLQGLDEATIASALGLDLTMASGNQQFTEGGGANKPLQVGMTAHNAIYSLALAKAGLQGSIGALEGRLGYYATYAEPGSDLEGIVLDLEAPGEVLQVGLKPYPSCRYSHAAIDGVMALMAQQGLAAEDVESIDLAIPEAGYQLIGAQPELKRRPASVTDAQFSLYFAAAAAAVEGSYSWQSYEKLHDARIQGLMDRTNVSVAPDLTGMQAHLSLAARGGSWSLDVPYPKGEPELPLTWTEVEAKFRSLATHLLDDSTAHQVIERVRNFEWQEEVSELMRLLRAM